MNKMQNNRRKFLRNSLLASIGTGLAPLANAQHGRDMLNDLDNNTSADEILTPQSGTITLLQTTDVHCQIHPHDELFWEDGKAVFRKTAGYAQLATMFAKIRKQNPHTFITDTGDMFQGSQLSVKTLGKAIAPILDALGYDLYLPGNWEVIYYKKAMQTLLGGLKAILFFRLIIYGLGWA
jgi:S-sulfosulfanyl-L-cysteine sulfohydrolase